MKPLGPVITEKDRVRCKKCGKEDALSSFWRSVRYMFEPEYYQCECYNKPVLALKFPNDTDSEGTEITGRIELNSASAELAA